MPRTNHLSPVAILDRSAAAFSDKIAVIDGDRTFTYSDLAERSARLAQVLRGLGVRAGDRVAALCANSHVLLEAHYAVPAAGAVLVPLNTRLTEGEVAHQIEHAKVKVLLATPETADRAMALRVRCGVEVLVGGSARHDDYERRLADHAASPGEGASGSDLLSISYTSGTTGSPKGVMHDHRAGYLQALSMVHHCGFTIDTVYLWTLPMFHCHGWGNTWAITAAGGTHVCLRTFSATAVWALIERHGVTHLSAAPTVLTMMLGERPEAPPRPAVRVTTGGAPPSPALIERMEAAGLAPQHLYGLTETLGPSLVNIWQETWSSEEAGERARLHARQGVPTLTITGVRVIDDRGADVPRDGSTRGEILLRGHTVTTGYYNAPEATAAALRDGWFHTGDVAVLHPDGYVEVADRLKDIIISGGENISSVEVERVLDACPGVLESAVVAAPDEQWGERPVAFIDVGDNQVDDAEITRHVRAHLAGFKTPRTIVRCELPKTATGKIRKDVLRERAAGLVQETRT